MAWSRDFKSSPSRSWHIWSQECSFLMTFADILLMKSWRKKATSESSICMRWMNTLRKQARIQGCSAWRIYLTRAEVLKSVWWNFSCNFLSTNMIVVKQYKLKSLHRLLCNSASFELRRVSWSSKIMFWQEFLKYILILWNKSSAINRAWGGDNECNLSANGAADIHAIEMNLMSWVKYSMNSLSQSCSLNDIFWFN